MAVPFVVVPYLYPSKVRGLGVVIFNVSSNSLLLCLYLCLSSFSFALSFVLSLSSFLFPSVCPCLCMLCLSLSLSLSLFRRLKRRFLYFNVIGLKLIFGLVSSL